MTEEVGSPADNVVELAEHWKKECNRYTNGFCSTRRCIVRGGWSEGPVDYDVATCEAHETVLALSLQPTGDVVERVAWKLAMHMFDTWGDHEPVVWAGLSADEKERARSAAKAALSAGSSAPVTAAPQPGITHTHSTASSEPTREMIEAGYEAAKRDGLTGPRSSCENLVRLILTSAMTAARKGGG